MKILARIARRTRMPALLKWKTPFPSGDDAETAHPGCKCHTESVVEDDTDADDE
jgi:hypothetical protein